MISIMINEFSTRSLAKRKKSCQAGYSSGRRGGAAVGGKCLGVHSSPDPGLHEAPGGALGQIYPRPKACFVPD